MDLKELIVKRRSIRKYDMTPLEKRTLDDVADIIEQTAPLIPGSGRFGFRVIGHDEFFENTKGMFRIAAPHYIVFFGDGTDDAYRNIGFVGELVVLKLTDLGLGTCWLGGATSKEMIDDNSYAISIAFGKPLEEFRRNRDEAKRRALNEIAEGFDDEQRSILEYVRLAPSAVNYQPWYFRCEKGSIHVFRTKTGGIMSALAKSIRTMQKMDIGIALAHFTVSRFMYTRMDIDSGKMTYEGTLLFGNGDRN
ncbi:MAG: hypothetical protein LBV13_00335 [Methanomassiliicoccaceae archaeon]|jgi:nitroreductase|nr:hypothetical protein [Methanomassiliicoccaceae archaeon]